MINKPKYNKTEKCLVCKDNNLQPLLFGYSRFNPKLFHRIAICKNCGHIQQYPLFKKEEYAIINDKFFGQKYLADGKLNIDNNAKKLRKIENDLSSYIQDGLQVLDVGPGETWAMDYFIKSKCKYSAIEHSDKLSSSIRDRGGNVIGKSIFDDYSKYESKFDIIIFRHVLEHLLNPKEGLHALKKLLSLDGLIYLALPNSSNPGLKKGFRTSYIRPVHISYFCEENVVRLANSAGLFSIHSKSDAEIVCLLKHGVGESSNSNYFERQKKVFIMKSKQSLIKDYYKIIRDIPKYLLKTIIGKLS